MKPQFPFKSIVMSMIFTTVSLASSFAFSQDAGDVGGGTVGGGDPLELAQQIEGKQSKMQPMLDQILQTNAVNAQIRRQRSAVDDAAETIKSWGRRVVSLYTILEAAGYKFNDPSAAQISSEMLQKTFDRLLVSHNPGDGNGLIYDNVSISSDPLYETNEAGDKAEVTFISDPATNKIVMNPVRLYNILAVDVEKNLSKERRNYDSPSVSSSPNRISVLATIFHEALRLNGIEGSRDYTFSSEFALVLKAMFNESIPSYKNPMIEWIEQSDTFTKCNKPRSVYMKVLEATEDLRNASTDPSIGYNHLDYDEQVRAETKKGIQSGLMWAPTFYSLSGCLRKSK